MSRFLSRSRYFILIAVLGSFVCACVLLGYGAVGGELESKSLLLATIEATDTFLLATLCYVVALGSYELFTDSSLSVPEWSQIRSLDDLKNKLLVVTVRLFAVLF